MAKHGKHNKGGSNANTNTNTNTNPVQATVQAALPTPAVPVQVNANGTTNTNNANTLYVVIGTKRGLTGNGGGKYSNANTMAYIAGLPGATTTGLTYAQYYAACVAFNHKGFCSYMFKSAWVVPVAAPTAAPAQVQGVSAA